MLGISRKNNECANMQIETAAMLILLIMCKQHTVSELIVPKSPIPLVSVAVDI